MRRPPACVGFVARTHAVVGISIIASVVVLHLLTRNLPGIEIGPKAYYLTVGLGGLYFATAALVWFGLPPGRILSRICTLLYLPRPQFGGAIWDAMNEPEFKHHFAARPG